MLLNLKTRTYWLISLVLFLLAIGFVLLCIYAPTGSNTVFIVLMTIDLILMTFAIQIAIQKSIKYKPKPIQFDEMKYKKTKDFDDELKSNGFTLRNRHIGRSYIKIDGNNAFKVVLITDSNKYFDNVEEPKDEELAEKLDKCNSFIGIEIFMNPNDVIREKIIDFSIETDKVYYTAIMKSNKDEYTCMNYINPNKNHKDNVFKLFELLGLEEIAKEENQ